MRAVVIGASGQDGILLTSLLGSLGYDIARVGREGVLGDSPSPLDVTDPQQVKDFITHIQPSEIYYLAAFHHSAQETQADLASLLDRSMAVNFAGLVNVLEAVEYGCPDARVFYASSALIFGDPETAPQDEKTRYAPVEAYGVAKVAGMGACKLYRDRGVFVTAGILYNHESRLRSPAFVSRKIVRAAVAASKGTFSPLKLGSLDTQIDWSAAEDVVRAMHALLQLDAAHDLVIASGTLHSIEDFARTAFAVLGMDYRDHVVVDDSILHRRIGQVPRHGDPSRLFSLTDYRPRISFEEMVANMVAAELEGGS